MKSRTFPLGGKEVTATELTIGQLFEVQEVEGAKSSMRMVSLSTGLSEEDISGIPASSLSELTDITTWVSSQLG